MSPAASSGRVSPAPAASAPSAFEPVVVVIDPSSATWPSWTTGSSEPVNASRGRDARIETPSAGFDSGALKVAVAPGVAWHRAGEPSSPWKHSAWVLGAGPVTVAETSLYSELLA